MSEESRAVRRESIGEAGVGIRGAEKLGKSEQEIITPRGMFRAEEHVFICFNRASAAAAAVWSVTVIVVKKMTASGEKVVNPFRDDDTLVGVET